MRTAILGTSHAAMLKLAADTWTEEDFLSPAPYFLTMPAPMLSLQNYSGWTGERGTISFQFPAAKNYLARAGMDPNVRFDPADFDVIILVDFFFCYDFSWIFRDRHTDMLQIDGSPISEAAYSRVLRNELGRSSYGEHSVVGAVPRNSVLPMLSAIRDRSPHSAIFLVPRPFQLAQNRDRLKIGLSSLEVCSMGEILGEEARRLLEPLNITFLSRTMNLIDRDTGLTPSHYSKGPLPSSPDILDEHMGAEYGMSVLEQIKQELNG